MVKSDEKRLFIVSTIFLLLQLVNVIGAQFGFVEELTFHEDLKSLSEYSFSLGLVVFTMFFRTLMPLYVLTLIYFFHRSVFDFSKVRNIAFVAFSVGLLILNIIFYDVGLASYMILKKIVIYDATRLVKIYNPIFTFVTSVYSDFVNPILVGCGELLRGISLIYIFKQMGGAKWFIYTGWAIAVYEIYGIFSSILEFLGVRFIWDTDASILDYTLMFFEIWITLFLVYKWVSYLRNKSSTN